MQIHGFGNITSHLVKILTEKLKRFLPYKYWSSTISRAERRRLIAWLAEAVLTLEMQDRVIQRISFSYHFNTVIGILEKEPVAILCSLNTSICRTSIDWFMTILTWNLTPSKSFYHLISKLFPRSHGIFPSHGQPFVYPFGGRCIDFRIQALYICNTNIMLGLRGKGKIETLTYFL